MDLWNKITGTVSVELTSADPERILGILAQRDIELWNVKRPSALVMVFQVQRSDLPQVRDIIVRNGGKLKLLGIHGVYYRLAQWRKRPILLVTIFLLLFASFYVPSRILFIKVVGNEAVPSRLIQETAGRFGLEFGVSRRQVRSEQIKNELLGAIEELEWVGVNTSGCTATITVRERNLQPEQTQGRICNVVASTDGIIESITMVRGTLLCAKGQAVQSGQLLVSGYSDLKICTRAVEAEAEIYALTMRQKKAVLPSTTLNRQSEKGSKIKISLILGKKRINLYSDSGILPSTCGKMTQVKPLRLPGELTLPITLVVERYTPYEEQQVTWQEEQAGAMLEDAVRRHLLEDSVAGQVLTQQTEMEFAEDCFEFLGRYECREMIARQDDGVYLEGDTKDDAKNGERGAG